MSENIIAKASGKLLPISTKQSVEICNLIRGKTAEQGKRILEQVVKKKFAVPYKRYLHGVGHKSGRIAAGRYPIKASSAILAVLKSAEANAQHNGISSPLKIKEIIANQASRSWHFGRHRRRKTKRTHIEIVLEEIKEKKVQDKKKQEQKQTQQETKRQKQKITINEDKNSKEKKQRAK